MLKSVSTHFTTFKNYFKRYPKPFSENMAANNAGPHSKGEWEHSYLNRNAPNMFLLKHSTDFKLSTWSISWQNVYDSREKEKGVEWHDRERFVIGFLHYKLSVSAAYTRIITIVIILVYPRGWFPDNWTNAFCATPMLTAYTRESEVPLLFPIDNGEEPEICSNIPSHIILFQYPNIFQHSQEVRLSFTWSCI